MIVRNVARLCSRAMGEAFAGHLRKTGEDHAVCNNLGVSVQRMTFRGWGIFSLPHGGHRLKP